LIQSIGKAFTLLDLIGHKKELGIAEMIKELRWKKSTVHRLAATLKELGYLEQHPSTMKYRLSFKLYTLGNLTKARLSLSAVALPFLQKLQRETDESVYLGIMDRNEVVYIEHVPSNHVLQPLIQPGFRAPLHCTAIGKVLLSRLHREELVRLFRSSSLRSFTPDTITSLDRLERALSQIRRAGFSVDNQEYHVGIRSIAAPIEHGTDRIVAAVSVAGPASRLDLSDLRGMVGRLRTTAEAICLALEGSLPAQRSLHATDLFSKRAGGRHR
jgi:DNA-binding IclR family transcriptional regulator